MALWTKKSANGTPPVTAAKGLADSIEPITPYERPPAKPLFDVGPPATPTASPLSSATSEAKSQPPHDASTTPLRTPEQQQKAAAASKMMMAAYGEIVNILSRSPNHGNKTLADLEWLAMPAVMTGQFSLAESQSKTHGLVTPTGLVTWASVSPDVDRRLTENIQKSLRLRPNEWKSGDILWLMDAVGEPKIVDAMLRNLVQTSWKGRIVRIRANGSDGTFKVGTIAAAPAETTATSV
jgi:hemolysin-activating ACP:hemolysin acyltransferase